ncbi:MAG TPA: ABC-type transport auxiliary lipoprotein family protein [Phycisphaerales bacterium]|nr:ABC-type transport auxiliary lipoprotein family protein [Phycisphaerales bacterium]HMP35860.1 ABC-type transport auxiliary lipoprotein family protein [Phycisphaerales bacterium]
MSLDRPYPDRARFGLLVEEAGEEVTPAVRSGAVRVARVRVAAPASGRSFVYRMGRDEFVVDYYNEFVAAPDRLLTAALVDDLARRGPFANVVDPEGTADAPRRVETSVTALYGDFRDDSRPLAVVAARVVLLDEFAAMTRQVAEWSLRVEEPIPSPAAADLAAGYGRAWSELLRQLRAALASTR